MLIQEYNIRHKMNWPPEVIYSGELLQHLGFIFLLDFGWANCVDKATDQYIAYLEYAHQRETNGY